MKQEIKQFKLVSIQIMSCTLVQYIVVASQNITKLAYNNETSLIPVR